MTELIETDICVIGAGSGGLSVASGAVQMGARVVLIEGGEMGGDCLNTGCVPSKALLAAAARAQVIRASGAFGLAQVEPQVDFAAVNDHVHGVIASIAPNDSVERFESLGVRVIRAYGAFVSPAEVRAGAVRVTAKRFVIATGSSPSAPPIPGLDETPYLTNETVFANREPPERLIIIGAGPIGMEMAQAHRRLGSRVVALEAFKALGAEDPEMTAIVLANLRAEGVDLREDVKIARVSGSVGAIEVQMEDGEIVAGTHLLIAAGRRPNLDRLDLDKAGIASDRRGVKVDARLRAQGNHKVYVVGDAAGGLQFTHMAAHHAGIVLRNALFRLPAKSADAQIPWVTYTDPEIAHVGLSEARARATHGDALQVLRWPYAENDRAQAEHATKGLVKVMAGRRGKILGASIVGKQAGELIQTWALAMSAGIGIGKIAGYVSPYPTLTEVNKRVAGSYYTPKLFSERTRKIVKFLLKFG